MRVAVLRKPTMRVALVLAFLLIVGLWGYTGYEFTSRMAAVEDASAVVTARYLKAQERLTTIRSQVLVAAVHVRDALLEADRKPEPKRTQALRQIKAQVLVGLRKDISGYRQYASWLRQYRQKHELSETAPSCEGVHVAISLKYCHIYNDLAHLHTLDHLLSAQGDLFGL